LIISPATQALTVISASWHRSLNELYPHASEDAIDLLKKLLHFNPNKRLSAEEAIAHPFVAQFRYNQLPDPRNFFP
jgi:mitogen-activated protein kinase 15